MSIESRSMQYGELFDGWQLREFIGEGSNGRTGVYRTVRTHGDFVEERALKIVNVVSAKGSLSGLTAGGRAEYAAHRDRLCGAAQNEVRLMGRLEGDPYIVNYLNWKISDWEETGQFGSDLLIQMQLLETLDKLMEAGGGLAAGDILQVGADICRALLRCEEEHILHRDVKPANIFRHPSGRGHYMLGDFGVSRIVDGSLGSASTAIGTAAYAAPEQIREGYDSRVDLYSLGLTLYQLANQGRLPFAASRFENGDWSSVQLRLGGTRPLPEPSDAGPALGRVILKACAFRPEDRFQTAREFLDALEELRHGAPPPAPAEEPKHEGTPEPESKSGPVPPDTGPSRAVRARSGKKKCLGGNQARNLFPDDVLRNAQWDEIDLTVPEGYTTIGSGAFSDVLWRKGIMSGKGLVVRRLILPDTLEEIQPGAFAGLGVARSVRIPPGVREIGDLPTLRPDAFVECEPGSAAQAYCQAHRIRWRGIGKRG